MKERIQKVLANAGVASRRNVEEMIRQGRVTVNGRVVTELPVLIDPQKDKVSVDDESVRLREPETKQRYYFLLNKPKGVYTTNVAQGEQVRAVDLLPPDLPARLYPVGRLDAESKGLLILTNDGDLTNQLTHPRYGVPKTYRAVVDGYVRPETVQELEKVVRQAERKPGGRPDAGRSHITVVRRGQEKSILEITTREGLDREVRRMLAKLGHKVRDLTRTKMGPITIDKVPTGHVRQLTMREVKALRSIAQKKSVGKGGPAAAGPETE